MLTVISENGADSLLGSNGTSNLKVDFQGTSLSLTQKVSRTVKKSFKTSSNAPNSLPRRVHFIPRTVECHSIGRRLYATVVFLRVFRCKRAAWGRSQVKGIGSKDTKESRRRERQGRVFSRKAQKVSGDCCLRLPMS